MSDIEEEREREERDRREGGGDSKRLLNSLFGSFRYKLEESKQSKF